ncbi:hypothetical protein AB6D86_15180 [Vibrio splendidus]
MTNKLTNDIDKIAFFEGNIYPDEWNLTNLKQINCFIGPNNSGKSRQLRELFSSSVNDWIIDTYSLPAIEVLKNILEAMKESKTHTKISSSTRYIDTGKIAQAVDQLIQAGSPRTTTELGEFIYPSTTGSITAQGEAHTLNTILISDLETHDKNAINEYNALNHTQWDTCYIPTLRSLRNLEAHIENSTDLFKDRTIGDYFFSQKNLGEIFTGYSLYQDLVKHLLGSHAQRKKVRKYEQYLSRNFFLVRIYLLFPWLIKTLFTLKKGIRMNIQSMILVMAYSL